LRKGHGSRQLRCSRLRSSSREPVGDQAVRSSGRASQWLGTDLSRSSFRSRRVWKLTGKREKSFAPGVQTRGTRSIQSDFDVQKWRKNLIDARTPTILDDAFGQRGRVEQQMNDLGLANCGSTTRLYHRKLASVPPRQSLPPLCSNAKTLDGCTG